MQNEDVKVPEEAANKKSATVKFESDDSEEEG